MTRKQIKEQSVKYANELDQHYDESDKSIARRAFQAGGEWVQDKTQGEVDYANETAEMFAYQCEKTARKKMIADSAKWIRENISDAVAVDYLNFMEGK